MNYQIKVLNKRLFREIKSNFRSFISIILISLLCVTLFCGLSKNYHNFDENLKSLYNNSNIADLFVTVDKCNETDYNELKNNNKYNISQIEKRIYSDAYINERKVYLIAQEDSNKLSKYASITEGKYSSNGVLITSTFARRNKIKVGDTITMTLKISLKEVYPTSYSDLFKEKLNEGYIDIYNDSDEMHLKFKVTGIMHHAESTGNLATSTGVLYMNPFTLKESVIDLLKETYSLGQYYEFIFSQGIKKASLENQFIIKNGNEQAIRNYFLNKDNNNLNLLLNKDNLPGNSSISIDLKQSQSLCYVFPVIFYIVGVLILIVTIKKQIDKDKTYIASLSSLGVSKYNIIMHYSKLNMILISIGGLIGLILGPILIPYVMNIKYSLLYNIPNAKHNIIYIEYIICFLILFLITFLLNLVFINKYLKKSPASVIKGNDNSFKPLLLEKIKFISNKMSLSLKMALRNIKKYLLSSVLTIIGVLGCCALLISAFGIDNTLDYGIELEFNSKIKYDMLYTYNEGSISKEYIKDKYKEISYIEELQYNVIMLEGNNKSIDTSMTIIEDNTKSHNLNLNKNGIGISKKIADSLNINVGDKVNIHYSNKIYEVEVSSIVSLFMSQGVYFYESVSPFMVKKNRAYIEVYDESNIDYLKTEISNEEGVLFTQGVSDKLNQAYDTLDSIRMITLVIKIFAILLAICVLYNLCELNFKERTRDISTMKVLGYSYKTLIKNMIYEILLLSISGGLLGTLFGYPLLYGLLSINEPPQIGYIYYINPFTYILAILITCGCSIIMNLLSSLKINKIKMVESLKNIE